VDRTQPKPSDSNVGIARNVQAAAAAGIVDAIVAENQSEVKGRRIGWRTNNGDRHRTVLVATAGTD